MIDDIIVWLSSFHINESLLGSLYETPCRFENVLKLLSKNLIFHLLNNLEESHVCLFEYKSTQRGPFNSVSQDSELIAFIGDKWIYELKQLLLIFEQLALLKSSKHNIEDGEGLYDEEGSVVHYITLGIAILACILHNSSN